MIKKGDELILNTTHHPFSIVLHNNQFAVLS